MKVACCALAASLLAACAPLNDTSGLEGLEALAATQGTTNVVSGEFDPNWIAPDLYFRNAPSVYPHILPSDGHDAYLAAYAEHYASLRTAPVLAEVRPRFEAVDNEELALQSVKFALHPAVVLSLVAVLEIDSSLQAGENGLASAVEKALSDMSAAYLAATGSSRTAGRSRVRKPLPGPDNAPKITPLNRATLAVYEVAPSHAWVERFHKVYVALVTHLVEEELGLVRRINEGFLGGPCDIDSDCLYEYKGERARCMLRGTARVCGFQCDSSCQDVEGAADAYFSQTFCIRSDSLDVFEDGLCVPQCVPGAERDQGGCEEGFECSEEKVPRARMLTGYPGAAHVCVPLP